MMMDLIHFNNSNNNIDSINKEVNIIDNILIVMGIRIHIILQVEEDKKEIYLLKIYLKNFSMVMLMKMKMLHFSMHNIIFKD
jgi:hypothetical protein